jgi:RHS repeat-associated protein
VATSYIWCGARPCQARNASNAVTRAYYAEGEFSPGSPGVSAYYAPDQIGSVRRVFTSASAPVYDYDPYGAPLQTTSPATDFGWAGMFNQADAGLDLTPARAYSPVLGRWLSRDPMGEDVDPDGNLYVYVGGEPVVGTDPSGLAVFVGQHTVWNSPFSHNAIVLEPDNPEDFANNPLFRSTCGKLATLGAQPFGSGVIGLFGGLVFEPNWPTDTLSGLQYLTPVAAPVGESDTEFIRALISAAYRYQNNAMYDPFPAAHGFTYNSNSFVSGVIRAAGGTPPPRPGYDPGYERPLPIPAPHK